MLFGDFDVVQMSLPVAKVGSDNPSQLALIPHRIKFVFKIPRYPLHVFWRSRKVHREFRAHVYLTRRRWVRTAVAANILPNSLRL